jgi:predicted metal-dependent HD superfamily phosphohydrolase
MSRSRWIQLWDKVGATGDPLLWFDHLAAAYVEPHRHYHTLRHIAECIREFDAARFLARTPEAVELALWFHDAVYDPKAPDNEEQSAELAKRCLADSGVSSSLTRMVAGLVMATKHHDTSQEIDAPLLVDIDLSILGQPNPRFLEYEMQIREEYHWVPERVFDVERAKILERFLARERLYATEWFCEKYEKAARTNLASSIIRLRSKI